MTISIHARPAPQKLIAIGLSAWATHAAPPSKQYKAIAREALEALLDQAQKRGYRDSRRFITRMQAGKVTPKVIEEAQRICLLLGAQVISDALIELCDKQTAALVREWRSSDAPSATDATTS